MPTLLDWRLDCACNPYHPGGAVWAHGIVLAHPRFSDGDAIRTSPIVSARSTPDALSLTTRSGREYRLPLDAIDLHNPDYTGHLMKEALGLAPSLFSSCLTRRQTADAALLSRLQAELPPGTLRLSLFSADHPSAWFCCEKGEILPVEPYFNAGTTQNSVHLCDYPRVNFRYFPSPASMEPYHIGETITRLEVENRGSRPFFVRVGSSSFPCPPGRITAFDHAALNGFRATPNSHCCMEDFL